MLEPFPELEFRDGTRVVPPHVALILSRVETWNLTYEEAIKLANAQLLRDRLNDHQFATIHSHFRSHR